MAGQRDLPVLQTLAPHSVWESLSDAEKAVSRPEGIRRHADGMLQSLLTNPTSALILIAEVARQPVGYLLGGAAPDSSTGEVQGYLVDLFVAPQYRRRGIGRALYRAGLEQFSRAGLRKAKMWTGLHNAAAVRMAATLGFQPEGLIGVKEW